MGIVFVDLWGVGDTDRGGRMKKCNQCEPFVLTAMLFLAPFLLVYLIGDAVLEYLMEKKDEL